MSTMPTDDPAAQAQGKDMTHQCRSDDWIEEYYGYRCRTCGNFVPFGSEPWAPDDDEVADMVRDAFAETREQAERERAGERLEPGLMEFRMRNATGLDREKGDRA